MKGNQVRASAEGTGLRQMDLVFVRTLIFQLNIWPLSRCAPANCCIQALLYRVRQNDLLVVI